MNINLKISLPQGTKIPEFQGILLSFFTTVDEVVTKRRRSSYLQFFYQERLDKNEKRVLRSVIGQIQKQLSGNTTEIHEILGSSDSTETKIPVNIRNLFNTFQYKEKK